jgi:hypothetical protein
MKIYGKCRVKNYSPQILDVRRELSDLRLRSSAVVQKVAEHVFALAQVGLGSLRKFPSSETGTHGLTEVSPALPELPSSLKCACSAVLMNSIRAAQRLFFRVTTYRLAGIRSAASSAF